MSRFEQVFITDPDDGTQADVILTNGYNGVVTMTPGHVSTDNSTTATLGGGATYTGTWEDVTNFGVIVVTLKSDQASATDGLQIQFSCDGITSISSDVYTIPASTGKTFSFQAAAQYYRIVYTNGATPQGTFDLQTVLKPYYVKPSSHRISDAIITDDDAELVKAVITGENPAGAFVNFTSTTSGNFKVSLEELETGVSSNSNSQLNVTPFHADGTEGALVTGVDYVAGKSGVDASTEGLYIIRHEHHEIHEGDHYEYCSYADQSINNVIDIQITTPNTTTWTHLVYNFTSEAETLWQIYENVSIVTPGTSITPRNNNRNSGNTSGLTIALQNNTSTANANADTAVAGATLISDGVIGSGFQSGGQNMRERELILKQNEDYTLRLTSTAAGYINWCLNWYEHVDKN